MRQGAPRAVSWENEISAINVCKYPILWSKSPGEKGCSFHVIYCSIHLTQMWNQSPQNILKTEVDFSFLWGAWWEAELQSRDPGRLPIHCSLPSYGDGFYWKRPFILSILCSGDILIFDINLLFKLLLLSLKTQEKSKNINNCFWTHPNIWESRKGLLLSERGAFYYSWFTVVKYKIYWRRKAGYLKASIQVYLFTGETAVSSRKSCFCVCVGTEEMKVRRCKCTRLLLFSQSWRHRILEKVTT